MNKHRTLLFAIPVVLLIVSMYLSLALAGLNWNQTFFTEEGNNQIKHKISAEAKIKSIEEKGLLSVGFDVFEVVEYNDKSYVSIVGWAVLPVNTDQKETCILIEGEQIQVAFQCEQMQRKDVVAFFDTDSAKSFESDQVGFSALIPLAQIKDKSNRIGVWVKDQDVVDLKWTDKIYPSSDITT